MKTVTMKDIAGKLNISTVSGPVADIILDQNRPSGAYKNRAVRGLAEDVIRMFKAD